VRPGCHPANRFLIALLSASLAPTSAAPWPSAAPSGLSAALALRLTTLVRGQLARLFVLFTSAELLRRAEWRCAVLRTRTELRPLTSEAATSASTPAAATAPSAVSEIPERLLRRGRPTVGCHRGLALRLRRALALAGGFAPL
jgi:hypothetical protein